MPENAPSAAQTWPGVWPALSQQALNLRPIIDVIWKMAAAAGPEAAAAAVASFPGYGNGWLSGQLNWGRPKLAALWDSGWDETDDEMV